MQTDYMFAVQEVGINRIYIPPSIKEENHVYVWLKMIAGLKKKQTQSALKCYNLAGCLYYV